MKAKTFFFLVLTNVLGGSAYVATGYALPQMSDINILFFRTLLGALFFLPWLIPALRTLKLSREDWIRTIAVGLFGYGAPLLLGVLGQRLSSGTNASLMIGVEPVAILVLSALFLGEKLHGLKILAVLAGLVGVCLIVFQGKIPFVDLKIEPRVEGDILLFLHGVCWSLYSVIGKPVLRRVDPMSFTALTTAIGAIPMCILAIPGLFTASVPAVFPWEASIAVFYLALGVSFFGTLTWNLALDQVPASMVANFIFLQPLVGVLFGVFFLHEQFTIWSGIGGVLVLLGVYAATHEPKNT